MKKNLNTQPGKSIPLKDYLSGFLFEDTSSDDEFKDFHDTLEDSVTDTKLDIENDKEKSEELNKVLSITKDTKKRNYLADQAKNKKDELTRKNQLLKNQQASLDKEAANKAKPDAEKKEVAPILNTATQSAKAALNIQEIELRKKIKTIMENSFLNQNPAPEPVKKKSFKVVFDKASGKPWEVLFTERGFLVGGNTRLSFENVEMAIHKNFNIVLEGGQGLNLDQVKLNKIIKYKDRF